MDPEQTCLQATEWQLIWQEHAAWLRTVLRARVQDEGLADELLQDVNVAAWQRREQLCDQLKIGPWLYRIAIRRVLMYWRGNGRQRQRWDPWNTQFAEELTDKAQMDPLRWLANREIHEQVRSALAELAPQDREILMLKHAENWTYDQVARRLGMTTDKVIYRIARARNRLKQRLCAIECEWDLP